MRLEGEDEKKVLATSHSCRQDSEKGVKGWEEEVQEWGRRTKTSRSRGQRG